jgi:hypothetical protein
MGKGRSHRVCKFPRKRGIACDFVEIFKWQKADGTRCRSFSSNSLAIPLASQKHTPRTKTNHSAHRSRGSQLWIPF